MFRVTSREADVCSGPEDRETAVRTTRRSARRFCTRAFLNSIAVR